jgi:pilus assembly protein CpaB
MRRGNLFILLIAIVMGGVAAFMARNWIQAHATVTPNPTRTTIVVASAPLTFGVTLSGDNVVEMPWASSQLPDGAFATREQLLKDGRRAVLAPVAKNEPILASKITGAGQRASLSALLEDGKRAVTVRVDDVKGVAGFVLPGDRVDVLLIRTAKSSGGGPTETFSDVMLQHVKVLAVDQLVNERQETPTIAKAVTLEVSTEQAQKIMLATNIGKLSLILRQQGENEPKTARRVNESDLGVAEVQFAPAPAVAGKASEPRVVRNNSATVEIIRGMRGEKYDVVRSQ